MNVPHNETTNETDKNNNYCVRLSPKISCQRDKMVSVFVAASVYVREYVCARVSNETLTNHLNY